MDDKPAIEYHPFGTITLNFDDGPVKLRRCRLGDLQYAKDLLEEIRTEKADTRQAWVDEVSSIRARITNLPLTEGVEPEDKAEVRGKIDRMNVLAGLLDNERIEIVYDWLSKVAVRMGDGPIPAKEDWPIEMFDANTPNDVTSHWQTRPLASGKTLGQNRTTLEAANSGPPLHIVSSPPEPQQP